MFYYKSNLKWICLITAEFEDKAVDP